MTDEAVFRIERQRLAALASLAASGGHQDPTPCPPDEQLALFIEGRLNASERQDMTAHLNQCPDCYGHWLEVAAFMETPEVSTIRSSSKQETNGARHGPGRLNSRWIALPLAMAAALAYFLIAPVPMAELNRSIDSSYAVMASYPPESLAAVIARLPSPGEESSPLAFSEAPPSLPSRSFAAGIWQGKQALLGKNVQELPTDLKSDAGIPWAQSDQAIYHAFGRWTVLLWVETSAPQAILNLTSAQTLLDELRAELKKRGASEEAYAHRAIAAIDQVEVRILALQQNSDGSTRADVSRALRLAIEQLAP